MQTVAALMSKETGADKQRVSLHLRLLTALQNHIRKQCNANQQVDSLALEPLVSYLVRQLKRVARGRHLCVFVETGCELPTKLSTAFTILLTELVANAGQHGAGSIAIRLHTIPGSQNQAATLFCLEVSDDGKGFPVDFELRTHARLGLEIVEVVCHWDLKGELVFHNQPGGGARVMVYFPSALSEPALSHGIVNKIYPAIQR